MEFLMKKFELDAILHYVDDRGFSDVIGDLFLAKAIQMSNALQILELEMAMPILINEDIFEVSLLNNKGFIAKSGKGEKYLVVTRTTGNNIFFIYGNEIDPGLLMYELMSSLK